MALIKTINNQTPTWGEKCYFAENAVITGDVVLGDYCSVWFHAVIRGDVNTIRIGNKVNIQDGAVIHCTYKKTQTHIGNNVSVAHKAIVHGANLSDNVLIGMGAIIMDHVVIEENCIIAAGSVVTEGSIVKKGSVYAGTPARLIKKIKPEQFKNMVERIANNYVMYANWYQPTE